MGLSLVRVRARAGQGSAPRDAGSLDIGVATLEEFLVLAVLSEHEMCGREIRRTLSEHTDFGVAPGYGSLYGLLRKLVKDGALHSRRAGDSSRAFYSLTERGYERFLAIAQRWAMLNESIQSMVMQLGPRRDRGPGPAAVERKEISRILPKPASRESGKPVPQRK